MNTSTLSLRIKENLRFLADKHGLNHLDLSRGAHVSQPTVSRLFSGSIEDPRASTLEAIANFFSITVDQLIGNKPITVSSINGALEKEVTYVPILPTDNLDIFTSKLGKTTLDNWSEWLETEPSISKNCFAVIVSGESMWPQFIEGSLVIIDPQAQVQHRDYILCLLADEMIVLRQYMEDGNERILKPFNYGYKPLQLSKKDRILGVVIQSRNDYRR